MQRPAAWLFHRAKRIQFDIEGMSRSICHNTQLKPSFLTRLAFASFPINYAEINCRQREVHRLPRDAPSLPPEVEQALAEGPKYRPRVHAQAVLERALEEADSFVKKIGFTLSDRPPFPQSPLASTIKAPWALRHRQYVIPQRLSPVRAYLQGVIQDAAKTKPCYKYRSSRLSAAVKYFTDNKDQVWVPADKNVGVTVLPKTLYQQLTLRHLEDDVTYQRLTQAEHDTIITSIINQLFMIAHEFATRLAVSHRFEQEYFLRRGPYQGASNSFAYWHKRCKQFLFNARELPPHPDKPHPEQFRDDISFFYSIPKLHKEPVASRPIASSMRNLTTPLSDIISRQLGRATLKAPFVLQDSAHLIQRLKELRFPRGSKIFSADVVALYPSLPKDAVQWCSQFCFSPEVRPVIDSDLFPSRDFLERCLHTVLDNNVVAFEEELFLQQKGVAMGTALSPSFSNTALAWCERSMVDRMLLLRQLCFYGRYIDDIICIIPPMAVEWWPSIQDSLKRIMRPLQLTFSPPADTMDFLDLTLSVTDDGKIHCRPYIKAMNKFLYIPFYSRHPSTSKIAWIKAELLRLVRNSARRADYVTAASFFRNNLLRRGYPANFLNEVFSQVQYACRRMHLQQLRQRYRARYHAAICHRRKALADRPIPLILPYCEQLATLQARTVETAVTELSLMACDTAEQAHKLTHTKFLIAWATGANFASAVPHNRGGTKRQQTDERR